MSEEASKRGRGDAVAGWIVLGAIVFVLGGGIGMTRDWLRPDPPEGYRYHDGELTQYSDEELAAAEERKRRRRAAEAEREQRRRDIDAQFSAWDGSHRESVRAIKLHLPGLGMDPETFEHIETARIILHRGLLVRTRFRARSYDGRTLVREMWTDVDADGAAGWLPQEEADRIAAAERARRDAAR
jgi:hypothetical protein